VAVGTYDNALLELFLQSTDRKPSEDHVGHVSALLLQVVELEDIGVSLVAVRAAPISQVAGDEGSSLLSPYLPVQVDLLPM
jgi:hypothetical protein